MVDRLASVLAVPPSFFFETNDELARLVVFLHSRPVEERHQIWLYPRTQKASRSAVVTAMARLRYRGDIGQH
jgi:hypothetical protein